MPLLRIPNAPQGVAQIEKLPLFTQGIKITHPTLWSTLCKNSNLPLENVDKKIPAINAG